MENSNEEVKVYPTKPDADGWQYMDEGSEALSIETREDKDGNIFKRVQLTKGRTAIVRELTSKEMSRASQMAGKSADRMLNAAIAVATTVTAADGTPVKFVMEDVENWKARDTNRLQVACQQINF